MRLIKKILFALLVVFTLIQFIPRKINKSRQILSTDFTIIYSVPNNIQPLFKQACYDCHSNNTNYPWYSNIQPFRLWLDKHIREGKEELNFNEYGSYSLKRQQNKLKSIVESLKKGTMPLKSYKLMHNEARLSDAQKVILINWMNNLRDSIKTKN